MIKRFLVFVLTLLFAAGCGPEEKGSEEYISEINQWHNKRIERLKQENGWLNLVGLHWLKQGENSFGSANNNDIQFPDKAPEFIFDFEN